MNKNNAKATGDNTDQSISSVVKIRRGSIDDLNKLFYAAINPDGCVVASNSRLAWSIEDSEWYALDGDTIYHIRLPEYLKIETHGYHSSLQEYARNRPYLSLMHKIDGKFTPVPLCFKPINEVLEILKECSPINDAPENAIVIEIYNKIIRWKYDLFKLCGCETSIGYCMNTGISSVFLEYRYLQ